ncbi:MAG: hypothetical protein IT384_13430 [Deltaproteobacteria bacterium]|nr:hypothetical protein [Deltaproteobacteria bacterium]
MSRLQRLEEAAEHLRKARYAKAIDCYRALLSDEPDNAEVRTTLADAYARAKNAERAFHHFTRAANIYLGRGNHEAALAVLNAANAISPNEPDIIFRSCECLKALNRKEILGTELVALVRATPAAGDRRRLWALEELSLLFPDDLSVAQQRAEALAEAGRLDECVAAYKRLSARISPSKPELIQVLLRAADLAVDRADLAIDLAGVLLGHGRPREALRVVVPQYESQPENVAVLEILARTLEALGAGEKALSARIELLKARAKMGQRQQVELEVEHLMPTFAEEPALLEVLANALVQVRSTAHLDGLWRQMARVANRRGLRAERDRAVAALLRANSEDDEALDLGAIAMTEAGRTTEAAEIRRRAARLRASRQPSAAPVLTAPPVHSIDTPIEDSGTFVLGDRDVIEEERLPLIKSPWSDQSETEAISEEDLVPDPTDPRQRLASHPRQRSASHPRQRSAPHPRLRSAELELVEPATAESGPVWEPIDFEPEPSHATMSAARPVSHAAEEPVLLAPYDEVPEETTSRMEPLMVDQLRTMTRSAVAVPTAPVLPGELSEPTDYTEPARPRRRPPRRDPSDDEP